MKVNWSVIFSLILIAVVTLWAADAKRNEVSGSTARATTEAAVFTNDADSSSDTGVMFIVTVGVILSAMFFVSNATTQRPVRVRRIAAERDRTTTY